MSTNKLLLLPYPEYVRFNGGYFQATTETTKTTNSSDRAGFIMPLQFSESPHNNETGSHDVLLQGKEQETGKLRCYLDNPEGYTLRITRDEIIVRAESKAGYLYGAATLRQLIRQFGERLPCLTIGDAPKLSRRGIQLCFPQGHTVYNQQYMFHLIPELANLKINELYLYLESYFDFPSLPHLAGPGAMTPEQAIELDQMCRAFNIKLIPMLNLLGHCGEILATQKYQHLSEHPADRDRRVERPFNLCASSPETEKLVDAMLDDLMNCFSADLIHIGGDEVSCLGECPRCDEAGAASLEKIELYSRYFSRIIKKLAKNGRRGGLWGDMFLHHTKDLSVRQRKKIFKPFLENTVIFDWQYNSGNRESLEFFKLNGLETIACSSTHLCYTSFVCPAQAINQRKLYSAAITAGISGGMTTAWGNMHGAHEELYRYLQASSAALLWSGAQKTKFAGSLSLRDFEKSYSFQCHRVRSDKLINYLHAMGDLTGPVLSLLAPLNGVQLRKIIYHSDNVLLFWFQFCSILKEEGFRKYRQEVSKVRKLWQTLLPEVPQDQRHYITFFEAPLLMHEQLIHRYQAAERAFRYYDQAAKFQHRNKRKFEENLEKTARVFEELIATLKPVEILLKCGHRILGFDRSSINRLNATKKKTRELAAFIRHLKTSHRLLPAFQQLGNVFLTPYQTRWYGDREHEWAAEPVKFQRYSLNPDEPWQACGISHETEQEFKEMLRQ